MACTNNYKGNHFAAQVVSLEKILSKTKLSEIPGQVRQAPENFLPAEFASDLSTNGMSEERRGFLRKSFMGALGAGVAAGAGTSAFAAAKDDPAIVEKQVWQTT